MYKILNYTTVIPTSEMKYSADDCCSFSSSDWSQYYGLPFKILKDLTLLWFQYQILQRPTTTNYVLHKIKYVHSNVCDLCLNEPETLQHLFYSCPNIISGLL